MTKRSLSIYADVVPTGGSFLFDLANGLREYELRPEAMVWSLIAPDRVAIWAVFAPGREQDLPNLLHRIQQIPGVTKVEIGGEAPRLDAATPGQSG